MQYDNHFLKKRADVVAPRLLGCELVREVNGQQLEGKIVETETYCQLDAARQS